MSVNLSDEQLKVLILFALKSAVSPIPQSTLGEILGNCDINYFNIGPVLEEVIETNLVSRLKEENTTFLVLSDKGREIADILKGEISVALRQKVVYYTSLAIGKLRKDLSVETSVNQRLNNGLVEYVVNLKLKDDGADLMNLFLYSPTELQAEMIINAFKENPQTVYKKILETFIKR